MIASLPMYDWPELTPAHDAFWQELSSQLHAIDINAPAKLTRDLDEHVSWLDPNLLIGQTCGFPLATILKGKVKYLATPVYSVEGCKGPYYSSAILARKDSLLILNDLQGATLAYNADISLSGYRAIKAKYGEPSDYFSALREAGSHRRSARDVASGKADVAALDAVCWHFLQQLEPNTANKLKVIGWTDPYPALPLITSMATSTETISAMRKILLKISAPKALAISGFEILDTVAYDQLAGL